MGKNLKYWNHPISPNMWQCLKIPQDGRPQEKIKLIEATKYFAIFENTTKVSATRNYLNYWRHQICAYVWKYHKIAGHGEKLKLLKPPNDFDVWRYHKIASNGGNLSNQKGNVWKYHKIAGHGPNILHCLKTQQNFQQLWHLNHWSHQICDNVRKPDFSPIFSHLTSSRHICYLLIFSHLLTSDIFSHYLSLTSDIFIFSHLLTSDIFSHLISNIYSHLTSFRNFRGFKRLQEGLRGL